MVNVCSKYGQRWDISFSSSKSQYIIFGGIRPNALSIMLNNCPLTWADKLKYLGCYFCDRSCRPRVDVSYGVRKFYGSFNNIMSVVGHGRNEMAKFT